MRCPGSAKRRRGRGRQSFPPEHKTRRPRHRERPLRGQFLHHEIPRAGLPAQWRRAVPRGKLVGRGLNPATQEPGNPRSGPVPEWRPWREARGSGDEENLPGVGILDFAARRKSADIHITRIRSVRARDKSGLTRDRRSIRNASTRLGGDYRSGLGRGSRLGRHVRGGVGRLGSRAWLRSNRPFTRCLRTALVAVRRLGGLLLRLCLLLARSKSNKRSSQESKTQQTRHTVYHGDVVIRVSCRPAGGKTEDSCDPPRVNYRTSSAIGSHSRFAICPPRLHAP